MSLNLLSGQLTLPPIGETIHAEQNHANLELLTPVSLARQIYQQKRRQRVSPRPGSPTNLEKVDSARDMKSSGSSSESLYSLANSLSFGSLPQKSSSSLPAVEELAESSHEQLKNSLLLASKVKVKQSRDLARLQREMAQMRHQMAELQVRSNKEVEQLKYEKASALQQARDREQLLVRQKEDFSTRVRDLESMVSGLRLELKKERAATEALAIHSRRAKQYQDENSRLCKIVSALKKQSAQPITLAQSWSTSNQTLAASSQSLKGGSTLASAACQQKDDAVKALEKKCSKYVQANKELKKKLWQFASANAKLANEIVNPPSNIPRPIHPVTPIRVSRVADDSARGNNTGNELSRAP